jgi:hypothetical protein
VLAAGGRQRVQSRFVRAAEGAIALGQTLWQPAAAYAWVDVHAVEGECVSVPGRDGEPVVLRVGPRADLLAPAQRILVSVATIGPALEETVRELDAGGDHLAAYLLDSAGVVAVGAVMEAVRCAAEEEAARLGWGVSASLSPGSLVGWPLEGQRELCALLPLAEIGVRLNAHCVLEPHKSASLTVGLGPGYQAHKVGSVCKFCALADTCWRRREGAE